MKKNKEQNNEAMEDGYETYSEEDVDSDGEGEQDVEMKWKRRRNRCINNLFIN